MEFNINKNATLPILKLELIQDSRNTYDKFYENIQNAEILFTMTDVVTAVTTIARKSANIEQIEPCSTCTGDQFYITYKFNQKETSKPGRYVAQFNIRFLNGSGNLIVPIKEELFINILEGSIKK